MTMTITVSPEAQERLEREARARRVPASELAADAIERTYGTADADDLADGLADEAAIAAAGTLSLFEQWAREDATDDPEELRRRQAEADALQEAIEANPVRLRGLNLSPADHE